MANIGKKVYVITANKDIVAVTFNLLTAYKVLKGNLPSQYHPSIKSYEQYSRDAKKEPVITISTPFYATFQIFITNILKFT